MSETRYIEKRPQYPYPRITLPGKPKMSETRYIEPPAPLPPAITGALRAEAERKRAIACALAETAEAAMSRIGALLERPLEEISAADVVTALTDAETAVRAKAEAEALGSAYRLHEATPKGGCPLPGSDDWQGSLAPLDGVRLLAGRIADRVRLLGWPGEIPATDWERASWSEIISAMAAIAAIGA